MTINDVLSKICPSRTATNNWEQKKLGIGQKISYGLGHIFNDLCANCWFSYLLLYMMKVVGLSNSNAGIVLLIGQVADAIFTPFIGYGCDKTTWKRYGRRKLWHAIGTICVLTSFPFVFNLCIGCNDASQTVKLLYYSGFVVVFQFGWAAVQISHLSLIPEIAFKVSQKVELNAIRSGMTFVCGIFVFGTAWLLLGANSEENVGPAVAKEFTYLTIVVIVTGSVFTLLFHIGTFEPKQTYPQGSQNGCAKKRECIKKILSPQSMKKVPTCLTSINGTQSPLESQGEGDPQGSQEGTQLIVTDRNAVKNCQEKCKTWQEWFKSPLFYKMAVVYMCTRLTVNVSQTYLVLYLTETLVFKKEAIAYFPLLVLVSGIVTSSGMKFLNKKIGSKLTYILGSLFAIGACAWYFMLTRSSHGTVYAAAVLSGSGASVMLVTSLAMTADLIGSHKSSGAFVYAAMSFTDKLSSGVVIAVIQALKPDSSGSEFCASCAEFTKYIQAAVPGCSALIALLCVAFLFPTDFVLRQKVLRLDAATQTIDPSENETSFVKGGCSSQETEDKTGLIDSVEDSECIPDEHLNIDDSLKRLSWHSALTSYVAWRLASPHLPSPTSQRRCSGPEPV